MNYQILNILPLQQGVSERGEWKNQSIIVEAQQNVQYPNRYLLTLYGNNVQKLDTLSVGDVVTAEWSSNVREYTTHENKKVYAQQNTCWKLELATL